MNPFSPSISDSYVSGLPIRNRGAATDDPFIEYRLAKRERDFAETATTSAQPGTGKQPATTTAEGAEDATAWWWEHHMASRYAFVQLVGAAISSAPSKPHRQRENTTTEQAGVSDHEVLLRDIQLLFRNAAYEDFEFGIESGFVRSLESMVAEHGIKAVEAMAHIILTRKATDRVISEALRWLGEVDHPESYLLRLVLLVTCLRDPSRWVRDGAALGLEDMNDRRAIPALRAAVAREPIHELRKDIESVLQRIEQMA